MQSRLPYVWIDSGICRHQKWATKVDRLPTTSVTRFERTVRTKTNNSETRSLIFTFRRHFSDHNVHAMDEVWYKRAVDQYAIEPESFVFSVPFNSGSSGKPLVMATHAVFIESKGHRAPVAVVGLQFQHSILASHFLNNITSAVSSCL